VLILLLLHVSLPSLAAGPTRHVLVLSSAERPHAPQAGFADALTRDLIRASRDPIQFIEIPVQPVRASDQAPGADIADRIRAAIDKGPLDLVVTIGGPAAAFAQQFSHRLFADIPVLIAGVDRRFVTPGTFSSNATTVATQHDPALMVDEILRLLPDTRRVMVVIGKSHLEKFWLEQMQREFARFAGRLEFSYTNQLSYDEILERSRTMPPQSAIFFALLSLDATGEPRVEGDTLSTLHATATAPLFALYGIGRGIVGGPMLSTDHLSRTTAGVAVRLLAGEAPAAIKLPAQVADAPTYDARQLRRWNIDEARLPAGSVVLFREPTVWQQHGSAVALGAVMGAAPLALLLIGGAIKRRRAHARQAGAAPAAALARADDTIRMWTADAAGRRADVGRPLEPPERWLATVHPEDRERCRDTYVRAVAKRQPFQVEYRVVDAGAERSILDTAQVRLASETFDGFVGTAVDITGLGRTRAELAHLSRHLLAAHERERAALARMLHEDVCQRMVALTLRLHALGEAPSDAEVADIRETLAALVSEIAAVPDPVHRRLELLGLAAAARRFCEDLAADDEAVIYFSADAVPGTMPAHLALALFRALEEAAVNALVHSGAREIWVAMRATADDVRVSIVDRGTGFDAQREASRGVGLIAMRERLKDVGGDIVIESTPGRGTRVEAWVPFPRRP
jgi:signal transduction histidine kinase